MLASHLFGILLLALAAVEPSTSDLALLGQREVVIHRQATTAGDGCDSFVAFIEVRSTREKLWESMLDFETMGFRSSLTREVTRYREEVLPDGTRMLGVRYRISVLGVDLAYHVMHTYDPVRGRLTWTLDSQNTNALAVVDGSFEILPGSERIIGVYTSRIDVGRRVPASVENWLQERQLVGYLKGLRAIAEGD